PDPSGPNLQVASGLTDRLDGTESRFGIEFTLDRPFCIGKPRTPDSNRIISDDIIPGNVLKALLANALGGNQTVLDGLRFDQWRVSHCLPMLAGSVGRVAPVMPLSLAKTGEEESPITEGQAKAKKQAVFHDMRALTLAQLAAIDWQQAPAFQPDWKDKDLAQIREKLGLSANRPKRILQVRTAIRAATGTAAQGQLFSMECVIPAGFVWRGTIDLGALPEAERKTALQQLSKTLGQRGLGNLGKTKAGLQNIKLLAKPFDSGNKTQNTSTATVKTLQPGEHLTLTLTLLTPARLFALGWERDDASRSAWDLYTRYWEQVSAGALVLTNFFAQQERQGGAYHYQHFQRHKDDKDGQYKPEWLTVAGSVFVLQVLDAAAAQDQITAWLQTGLPILEGDALTWKDTPYLPEHGFGEVVMNWQVADIPAYPVAEQGGGR
ncbi:MAG: hypothetical protein KDI15_13320, partial [Thiothrix sp.]|nr:hypothetical protein [Thiothrix sp.]